MATCQKLAIAAALLALWGCTCGKTMHGSGDGNGRDGATPTDGSPGQDGSRDGSPGRDGGRPEGTTYDFCGEPFFKLPMDGTVEESSYVNIWGEGVVYTKELPGPNQFGHGYYFDLAACTEYPISGEENDHAGPISIYDKTIVYRDCRYCTSTPEYHGADLFMLDIETWQEHRLTDDPYSQSQPKFNGRYLVYLEKVYLEVMSPSKLMLWDTTTDEKLELAPAGGQPGYFAISDRYVVWSAYTPDPRSVGKDVFYHDLQTHTTVHIDSTFDRFQYGVSVWGRYAAWFSSDVWTTPPYHLTLYNIETQDEIMLAENDRTGCYGTVHENLVAWTTGKYREDQDPSIRPADIEIYDIDTGVFRRVTTRPSMLRQVQVFFPYLVVVDVLGEARNMDDYYVAHLVRLGITDQQGQVIPGDGVLEPPR